MSGIFRRRDERGFTVAEVLVGIVLFGIMMPAVILAVMNLADLNDRAGDLTRLNIIAENKIEQLRNEGYNSLALGTVDFSNELDVSIGRPNDASFTVSQPENGVKKIDVTINYTEKGTARTLEYSSFISELGVAQ